MNKDWTEKPSWNILKIQKKIELLHKTISKLRDYSGLLHSSAADFHEIPPVQFQVPYRVYRKWQFTLQVLTCRWINSTKVN